ncbi:MAG: T9SS type A sorting domain-containing protein [Bacteroidota bacterium]
MDVTGKTVFSKAHFAVTSETGRLRLPAQASGVYFLRVTAGTGTEVVKLIAE